MDCEYCTKMLDECDRESLFIDDQYHIYVNDTNSIVIYNDENNTDDTIKVNYCPMCGGKL